MLNARIYDHTGDKEKAISEYAGACPRARGRKTPNVHEMKRDTRSALHGDPRFEALLNDPANNTPVF